MPINTRNNCSICAYPWNHSYIGSRYERKLCCIAKDIDEYKKTTTDIFWNSEYMKNVRLKMIAGEKIDDCDVCYDNELNGIESLRQQSLHSNELEEISIQRMIDSTDETGRVENSPTYFDYRTIHCNLQCISCGPTYSSQHISLNREIFPWMKDNFAVDYQYENKMAEEIINSLRRKEKLKIYWAGGEPMMSHVHWAVVEEMKKIQEHDPVYCQSVYVHYNTNMTKLYWKGENIPEKISFYQPSIQASIDGTHETFEYCRDGASWESVSENWKQYHAKLNENNQFGLASVMSSPVIMDIDRWFEFFEPYDPELHSHRLFSSTRGLQGFLDIRYFPTNIFDRVLNHAIARFSSSNLRGKERTIDILSTYKTERQNNLDVYENPDTLKFLKQRSEERSNYLKTKRTYSDLLKIIDSEAYDWYMAL